MRPLHKDVKRHLPGSKVKRRIIVGIICIDPGPLLNQEAHNIRGFTQSGKVQRRPATWRTRVHAA